MLKLFIADMKILVRNKQSLFWALMFPVMFTIIFGLFFGKNNNVAGTIDVINRSNTQIATGMVSAIKDAGLFTVKDETDEGAAKDAVKKGQISAVLIIPENFGDLVNPDAPKNVNVFYDPGSVQGATVLSNFANQYLTQASFQIQGAKPMFTVAEEKTGNGKATNYFDFVLAGVLGMALMNSSVISIAVGMSKYREDQILKRITSTPLKTWKFILGEVVTRLLLNIIQISIILFMGLVLFKGHFYGNLFIVYLLSLLGGLLFQLLGFVIASLTKNTDAAEGMATAVTIPMMFLAGVFFPIDALPKWLGAIVQFLPLAPLLRMIRGVALEANSPFAIPMYFYIVVGWIVALLGIAIWKFRLSEE